jgi:thioredoxin-like negative regulator of GroEL
MESKKTRVEVEVLDGASLEDLIQFAVRDGLPVVIGFMIPDEPVSEQLERVFDKVAGHYRKQLRFARCDPRTAPEIAEAYQVERVPDVLVMWGPRVTERLHGIRTFEELKLLVAAGQRRARILESRAEAR